MKLTLLVVVFTLLLKPVLPVFSYVINYDHVVKELCENRARPQVNCNGKCHLRKELAKASENEKPANQKKAVAETETLFCQFDADFHLPSPVQVVFTAGNTGYNNLYSFLALSSVLHPPASI